MITTIDSRPYHRRTVENCDALINKHLAQTSSDGTGVLPRCGLTRDEVRAAFAVEEKVVPPKYRAVYDCLTGGGAWFTKDFERICGVNQAQVGQAVKWLNANGYVVFSWYHYNKQTKRVSVCYSMDELEESQS